jgi:hypothetical protein
MTSDVNDDQEPVAVTIAPASDEAEPRVFADAT